MRDSSFDARTATGVLERPEGARAAVPNERGQLPIAVDLDGTIVASDLMIESLLLLAKRRPLQLPAAASWLAHGRAYFKQRLAREYAPDIVTLPYNRGLIAYLEAERRHGREIVLATGADDRLAAQVADYLGIFDRVLGSDGVTNLSGAAKRDLLVAEYGLRGFDYIGDGHRDGAVRAAARTAVFVQPGGDPTTHGASPRSWKQRFATLLGAVRPHQWLKNLLVFAPLLLAHRFDGPDLLRGFIAFAAFCFCASGGYVFNDLLDLPGDRHHPHKKNRPLASGQLPAAEAIVLMLALPVAGFALALLLPPRFAAALGAYYAVTLTYSLRLKDLAIVDVLTLAGLYALRALGGAAAAGLQLPSWLLGFCLFLFLGLALIKRYAELLTMRSIEGAQTHARAYLFEDRELLAAMGIASGFVAVVILGLYVGTSIPRAPGLSGSFVWIACLLLIYWIAHMWLMAHRGRIVDDPVAFALHDRASQILILLLLAVFIAMGQP